MLLRISSAKRQLFCLQLDVLDSWIQIDGLVQDCSNSIGVTAVLHETIDIMRNGI